MLWHCVGCCGSGPLHPLFCRVPGPGDSVSLCAWKPRARGVSHHCYLCRCLAWMVCHLPNLSADTNDRRGNGGLGTTSAGVLHPTVGSVSTCRKCRVAKIHGAGIKTPVCTMEIAGNSGSSADPTVPTKFWSAWLKAQRFVQVIGEKGQHLEGPVSCWRSVFIANEFAELGARRRTNPALSLVCLVCSISPSCVSHPCSCTFFVATLLTAALSTRQPAIKPESCL
jgi:hypothetical protein